MIQIRLKPPCRREFRKDVYGPGVISLSRLIWGSAGAGLFLFLVAAVSEACRVGVLYPPLAATCFISAACAYLRVARPRQVIAGHFVSTVGGLAAVFAVKWAVSDPALALPLTLGLAVALAAALMQVFDADHPPAAATAAIPAILPLPADTLALPVHMAWGAVLVVGFSLAWNRVWFEFPAPEDGECASRRRFGLERVELAGLALCAAAFALMALRPVSEGCYLAGMWVMLAGLATLLAQPFVSGVVVGGEAQECPPDQSSVPPAPSVRRKAG
ncbi:hypothetical protein ASZ90_002460 [hydrocarbon metagenome]|uniref:HPP transmembrane region domain-containing protein n=1 Tax=hydrocarbon metagenome TaxID=938273 RepID=A0A0W8G3M0_9ZZZZ